MRHSTAELASLACGELESSRASVLHAHIATCDECRTRWQQLVALEHRLGALPRLAPAPDFIARVEARIAALPPALQQPIRWRVPVALLLTGCLWIAFMLGSSLGLIPELMRDVIAQAPAWNDIAGWLAWLQGWSIEFEATIVLALCMTTIGALLVVMQQLQSAGQPVARGPLHDQQ